MNLNSLKKKATFFCLVFLSSINVFAVGVGDLDPNLVNVALCFNQANDGRYNNFMSYNTVESERLYASMRAGETFRFGLQFQGGNLGNFAPLASNGWVRIKDLAGAVVFGPVEIVPGQAGYINNRNEALAGPASLNAGGYNDLQFTAAVDGDYIIEVAYSNDGNSHQLTALQPGWSHFLAPLYDFNVVDGSGNVIDGRVWSKAWHIVVLDGWTGPLTSEQYIYTDDGIVSKLDYNGIIPYEYVLISNENGTSLTGNPFVDRQSIADQSGASLMPQYKLFFDEPDTSYFPIADLGDLFGQLNAPIDVTGCDGNYCINVDVDREANALLLLDLNGTIGYQEGTSDRLLETVLNTGANCISWDGRDGQGGLVSSAQVELEITFLAGVTHMPMYDVEYNTNGLVVEFVYPESIAGPTEIYWDDSQVGGTVNDLVGCQTACHSWASNTPFGNEIIINSWWYIRKDPEVQQIAVNVPVVDAGPNVAFCAGQSESLQATQGFASYQWTPSQQFNDPGVSDPTVTGTTPFWAKLLVTDDQGCLHRDSLMVDALPLPNASVSPIQFCQGEQGQLAVSGGQGYLWYGDTQGLGNVTSSTPIVSINNSTTFSVEVTSSDGCKDSADVAVTVFQRPVANVAQVAPICVNESVQLQATGGQNYLWFTGASSLNSSSVSDPVASPTISSLYEVEVTDVNDCKDTAQVSVLVSPGPVAVIAPVNPICDYESAQLNASGGESFLWIENVVGLNYVNISSPIASTDITSTYTVVAYDSIGCRDTAEVEVLVNLSPVAAIAPLDSICFGESATLEASGGSVYRWLVSSGLSSSNDAIVVSTIGATTLYQVEVESQDGCLDTAEATLVVHPLPIASLAQPNAICAGDSTQLFASGGTGYFWYQGTSQLSNGQVSSPFASPGSTSIFAVEVENEFGCKDSAQVELKVSPGANAVIDPVSPFCEGETAQLNASGGETYQWIGNTSGLSSLTISTPTTNTGTTITYSVVAFDTLGCADTASIEVLVNQRLLAEVAPVAAICRGETTSLLASGGLSYSWISNAADLSSSSGSQVEASPLQTTVYTVEVEDANNCLDTAEVEVVVNLRPVVIASDSVTICSVESAQLSVSGANTYEWTPVIGLNVSTGNIVTANPTQSTLYTVVGTDANGCLDTSQVFVSVVNSLEPDVAITANDACLGSEVSAQITVSQHLGDAPQYSWYLITSGDTILVGSQDSFSSSSLLDGDQLFVSVKSNAACVMPEHEVVVSNVFPPNIWDYPELYLTDDLVVCDGDENELLVVDSSGLGQMLIWYRSGVDTVVQTGSSLSSELVGAGDFFVKSNHNGCETVSPTRSIEILYPRLTAEVNYRTIMQGESVSLSAEHNGDSLTWRSSLEGEVIGRDDRINNKPYMDVIYTANSMLGECEVSDTLFVRVVHPVAAPYFFSPNNDGSNDDWLVANIEEFPHHHITIYNRWGSIIRDYEDSFESWDGLTSRGTPVPDGVYFYVIETEVREDVPVELTGYVTVSH